MEKKNKIRVCVVEDDNAMRESLIAILHQSDEIELLASFDNAEELLQYITPKKRVELVLLDIGLPGMNGLEAIGLIKQLSAETRILILTVFEDDDYVFKAFTFGASGFVLKSAGEEGLITDIKRVHSGSKIFCVNFAKQILTKERVMLNLDEWKSLVEREKEVLRHLSKGLRNKQIADKMYISDHTVEGYLRKIYEKIQVKNRTEAVSKALDSGWV